MIQQLYSFFSDIIITTWTQQGIIFKLAELILHSKTRLFTTRTFNTRVFYWNIFTIALVEYQSTYSTAVTVTSDIWVSTDTRCVNCFSSSARLFNDQIYLTV